MTSTTADAADVRAAEPDPARGAALAPAVDPTGFLPLPERLDRATRRRHRLVLGLLMLFGLLQGAYWSVTTVTWNPVDEVAHFGYVESLATGHGVPTVGVDLLDDATLASLKETPTLLFRSYPYQPSNDDENWGGTGHQYEAVHGPTYYVAMIPAYWIGKPFGVTGSLYAIRFATVGLVLLSIPLTWMLARRLFPDRPVVWLLAPGLLIAVNSLSPGSVSNDAMVLVLSIATTLVFLRALDQPRSWLTAAGAGALFGLTIVTKMTSLVLIPFLALAFLAWVITRRPRVLAVARFVASFLVGAVVAFGPWLAWNLRTYHSTSAATVVAGITGASLPESQLGIDAIVQHATVARPGVWLSQLLLGGSYQALWEISLVVALVLGAVTTGMRRRWRDLAVLLWCGSALPLAFLSMEVIVFVLFDGTGGPMGRHLIAALAPTMVMVAAAAVFVLSERWAPPLVAAIVTASLVLQVQVARNFVDIAYLKASIDHLAAPVVYQDWALDAERGRAAIQIDADCPVDAIGVGFMVDPEDPRTAIPTTLVVRSGASTTEATGGGPLYDIATYRLTQPVTGPFTIEIPTGSLLRSTPDDRAPDAAFTDGGGDPVVTAYCPSADADDQAFERIYPIGHPEAVSLGMLQTFPALLAAAGAAVVLGLTINAARRPRRSPAPSSAAPPVPDDRDTHAAP